MTLQYSPEDVDRALLALVLTGGNALAAQRHLEAAGYDPPSDQTLYNWQHAHAARYEEIRNDLAPRLAKRIAADAEELATRIGQVEAKAVNKLETKLDTDEKLTAPDIATILRNASTSKALQIDKISSPLRERPSHVPPTANIEELVTRLARTLGFDSTSTAEEITETAPLPSADWNQLEPKRA